MEHFPIIETKETQPKLLFKVILMRHEKTDYTGVGSDLTDDGANDALKTGEKMKSDDFFSEKNSVLSFHSPASRAEATSDLTLQAAGIPTENSRSINALGPSKIFDAEAFDRHIDELEDDPAQIAQAYHTHDFHRNHPEIIEPHAKKKERFYRMMEYFIRSVMKHNGDQTNPSIEAFAVSHFEILTHLIDDVFGIENTGYRSPLPGEQIKVSAFGMEDQDTILLKVSFRELEKQVIFNRRTRLIE